MAKRITGYGMNSNNSAEKNSQYFYYMEKSSRMFYNKESNTMNKKSQIERRNYKWNVEMHGFLIQKQKKKN